MSVNLLRVIKMIEDGTMPIPSTKEGLLDLLRLCGGDSLVKAEVPSGGVGLHDANALAVARVRSLVIRRSKDWFHMTNLYQGICKTKWAKEAGVGKDTLDEIVCDMVSDFLIMKSGKYIKTIKGVKNDN